MIKELEKTAAEWMKLAREIAALLPTIGEGWTVSPHLNERILFSNGAGLRFTFGKSLLYAERARISIDHAYEYKYLPDNTPDIRITLSGERNAKGIAREIENRFLTKLSQLAGMVEVERERQEAKESKFAADVQMLREATGELFTISQKETTEAVINKVPDAAGFYLRDGRVSTTSVILHFDSLDYEEAATIMRALNALRDARRGVHDDETGDAYRDALAA